MLGADISVNPSALSSGNFGDIIDVNNRRTSGFPGFLMGWVEAQLDEITTSLTNLPAFNLILPDFE